MTMDNPIIIALDGMTQQEALMLARNLKGLVWGFKVNDLLLDSGLGIIRKLKPYGSVFADPKLYDIPNTVANSVRKLEAAGADLITVHASGGLRMLHQAVSNAARAKVLAVTLLTSFSDDESQKIYGKPATENVLALAKLAAESEVPGIVCSPNELKLFQDPPALRSLLKVTPGIRPAWHQRADDQTRTKTPKEALAEGASLIVVGRPVTAHEDPVRAVEMILEEID